MVGFVRANPNPTRKRSTSRTSLTRRVVIGSMNLRNSPTGGALAQSMQFPSQRVNAEHKEMPVNIHSLALRAGIERASRTPK